MNDSYSWFLKQCLTLRDLATLVGPLKIAMKSRILKLFVIESDAIDLNEYYIINFEIYHP